MFLSLAFQGEDLTPSSLSAAIADTYKRLELMKSADGIALKGFYEEQVKEEHDSAAETF